jgi:hypothetical protein
LQLTPAENTEIKDSSSATADLVISLSPSIRIRTYVRRFSPITIAEPKWLSGCAEKKNPSTRPSHKLFSNRTTSRAIRKCHEPPLHRPLTLCFETRVEPHKKFTGCLKFIPTEPLSHGIFPSYAALRKVLPRKLRLLSFVNKRRQKTNKQNTANNDSPAAQRNWYLLVG